MRENASRERSQEPRNVKICEACEAAGFRHRKLALFYCHHRQALRLFDGKDWYIREPCSRSLAYQICVNNSLKLWDSLADTHAVLTNDDRRRSFDKLDRLSAFLEGLRETA